MSLIPYDDDFFGFPSNFFDTPKMFKNPIKIDVTEEKDCFNVIADIPAGVPKSDIKLEFDKGYLTLNVSVKSETCDKNSCNCNYLLKERFSGQYSRRIFISDNLDRSGINASYKDSVLRIKIPKSQQSSASKSITIN